MREKPISQNIRAALGRLGIYIFTNPCGQGWVGRFIDKTGDVSRILGGSPISFGLQPGSPDLVGWRSVVVTREMVGQKIAVFVGIECKAPNGRHSKEQVKFLEVLCKSGALCGTARSVEEALNIVNRLESK